LSLLAIVLLIVTVIFITVAVALVLLGKIALFMLLGLGPLFICMALFNFSSALFTGWLRTCAQYALVPVIVYGILGFLLTLMNQTITNLGSITDTSSGMTVIAPFLILCGVGTALVPLSLTIAASIAGGHSLQMVQAYRSPFGLVGRGAWEGGAFGLRQAQRYLGGPSGGGGGPSGGGGGNTLGPGSNTAQSGAGSNRPQSAGAEQVAGALIATRAAQLRRMEQQAEAEEVAAQQIS